MKNIYIGCDVARSKIDYCVLSDDKDKNNSFYGQFKNSLDGYEKFLTTIAINYPLCEPLVAFEATGVYTKSFEKYLSDNSIFHKMFNPNKVSKYIKSMIIQGKTDKSDSYALAHFCSIQNLDIFKKTYSVDKEMLTRYSSTLRLFSKIKTQIINLNKSVYFGVQDEFLISELISLKKDLKRKEKSVRDMAIVQLRDLYPVVDIIEKKYSGVGFSLLLVLVPKIYETIEKYSINQTIAFLGFNPVSFSSGQMKMRDKLNIFGDKDLKKLLFLASLSSTQFNPILKEKYQNYLLRGKPKKLALTIIARKLLVLIIKDIKRYKKETNKLL